MLEELDGPILATLAATSAYGISSNFTKARLKDVPSRVNAAASLIVASLVLLPLGIWLWPDAESSPSLVGLVPRRRSGNLMHRRRFSSFLSRSRQQWRHGRNHGRLPDPHLQPLLWLADPQ